jgi:5-formyltetrahydrofolate cyclo-ligase
MLKDELRKELRTRRNLIPLDEQAQAAERICSLTCNLPVYKEARQIAFYWPTDNEISCMPLINAALNKGKHCFLPVLCLKNRQTLAFAAYDTQTPMLKNRYGILEPDTSYSLLIDSINLDIIFVPLVGFDANCWRLGRGGGFYDAAFADLHRTQSKKLPKLIGLAFDCQKVNTIPIDSWDWQLDLIVTEKRIYEVNKTKN